VTGCQEQWSSVQVRNNYAKYFTMECCDWPIRIKHSWEMCNKCILLLHIKWKERTQRPATEAPKLLTTVSECKHTWLSWQRDRDVNMTNGRKINSDRKDRQGKDREYDHPPADLINQCGWLHFPTIGPEGRRGDRVRGGQGRIFHPYPPFTGWESARPILLL